MTNKDLYKQTFDVLHASDNISLEVTMNIRNRKKKAFQKIAIVCACSVFALGLGVTAYAYEDQILHHIFGWGNNYEITTTLDENGNEKSVQVLHTDNLTDPVIFENEHMIFIVNNERIDITDSVSEKAYYRYEYSDSDGNIHVWLVGLLSSDYRNYGYAEYIKDSDDNWKGGYSARINTEADGSTSAEWLNRAKKELDIPW